MAALCGALTCGPAQADYYAFGNTLTAGYAVLDLDVNGTWYALTTQGVQGWISTGQYGVGGAYGANTSYTAGLYNGDLFNDYFGFNLAGTVCEVSGSFRLHYVTDDCHHHGGEFERLLGQDLQQPDIEFIWSNTVALSNQGGQSEPYSVSTDDVRGELWHLQARARFTTGGNTVAQLIFALNAGAVTDINTAIRESGRVCSRWPCRSRRRAGALDMGHDARRLRGTWRDCAPPRSQAQGCGRDRIRRLPGIALTRPAFGQPREMDVANSRDGGRSFRGI